MRRNRKPAVLAEAVVAKMLLVLGVICCSLPLATCTGCRGAIVTGGESELALPEPAVADSSTAAADTEPVYYYIILEAHSVPADNIVRVPLTDNETVLDALGSIRGLWKLSGYQVWINRRDHLYDIFSIHNSGRQAKFLLGLPILPVSLKFFRSCS